MSEGCFLAQWSCTNRIALGSPWRLHDGMPRQQPSKMGKTSSCRWVGNRRWMSSNITTFIGYHWNPWNWGPLWLLAMRFRGIVGYSLLRLLANSSHTNNYQTRHFRFPICWDMLGIREKWKHMALLHDTLSFLSFSLISTCGCLKSGGTRKERRNDWLKKPINFKVPPLIHSMILPHSSLQTSPLNLQANCMSGTVHPVSHGNIGSGQLCHDRHSWRLFGKLSTDWCSRKNPGSRSQLSKKEN